MRMQRRREMRQYLAYTPRNSLQLLVRFLFLKPQNIVRDVRVFQMSSTQVKECKKSCFPLKSFSDFNKGDKGLTQVINFLGSRIS